MFCLLYKHTNDDVFDDFPKISEDFPKLFRWPDERFRTFSEHFRTLSKDYRRLPKTTEEVPKMFRSYINKFKCSLKGQKKNVIKKEWYLHSVKDKNSIVNARDEDVTF